MRWFGSDLQFGTNYCKKKTTKTYHVSDCQRSNFHLYQMEENSVGVLLMRGGRTKNKREGTSRPSTRTSVMFGQRGFSDVPEQWESGKRVKVDPPHTPPHPPTPDLPSIHPLLTWLLNDKPAVAPGARLHKRVQARSEITQKVRK